MSKLKSMLCEFTDTQIDSLVRFEFVSLGLFDSRNLFVLMRFLTRSFSRGFVGWLVSSNGWGVSVSG